MSSSRLPLSSRPAFLPDEISRREFATVFRGYDPAEVRTFLNQLAEQSSEMGDRISEIQKALSESEERVRNPELTEEMVTSLLGSQTAQILRSAREAAADTRRQADEEVGRQLREAHEATSRMTEEAENLLAQRTDEAERMAETIRNDAARDAEEMRRVANEESTNIRAELASESERRRAELDAEVLHKREQSEREINEERSRSRQQAREMIETARAESRSLVARTQATQTELIEGLVRKRKIALCQLESLRTGRQRLLGAYKMVRSTLDDVTTELERVEDEARSNGVIAAQRAAANSEIEPEELSTVIELEQFELNDDVSGRVINLIDSQGTDSNSDDFFDQSRSTGEIDLVESDNDSDGNYSEEQEPSNIVNLTIVGNNERPDSTDPTDRSDREDSESSRGISSPTNILTRDIPQQQQTISVVADSTTARSDSGEDQDEQGQFQETGERQRTGTASLIIGENYAGSGSELDNTLKVRRDAVLGKARAQAVRRIKRTLQDEQDGVIARLRNGESKSIQALLGSADDQTATYHRAIVKLLREVVRSGVTSVPGTTGVERGTIDRTGTSAARDLAEQLVGDLRIRLVPVLEKILDEAEPPSVGILQQQVAGPYGLIRGDYLDQLVDERVGRVFDEGVAFAK